MFFFLIKVSRKLSSLGRLTRNRLDGLQNRIMPKVQREKKYEDTKIRNKSNGNKTRKSARETKPNTLWLLGSVQEDQFNTMNNQPRRCRETTGGALAVKTLRGLIPFTSTIS